MLKASDIILQAIHVSGQKQLLLAVEPEIIRKNGRYISVELEI